MSNHTGSTAMRSMRSTTSSWKKLSMFLPESNPPSKCRMLKTFSKITIPMTLSNVFGQLIFLTNTIFAGHMDDEVKLAAVGLGEVCTQMLVLQFIVGLNGS